MPLGILIPSLVLFIFGAAVGSFVNVLIYRTIRDEDWIKGRSKCDFCGKKLAWYDNIPLLSYLILGGKTRCCKKSISMTYPVVELMTAALFVWWYWSGSLFFRLTTDPAQTIQPFFWLLVGILLLLIFFADFFYLIIPDVAVGLLLVLTVVYRIFLVMSGSMQAQDLLFAVMGMLLSLALIGGLWLITQGKGMGFGDVKLAAPMALLLGWPKVIVGLSIAFVLGGLVAMVLLVTGRKKFGQVLPFGPFMVTAIVVSLLWGEQLFNWYVGLF